MRRKIVLSNMSEQKNSKEQEAIYDFVENGTGNAIIDAVAGAGKTTTIMNCAQLIPEYRRNKVPGRNAILFCAFNRKIVSEIEGKFKSLGVDYVDVKTCHGLGLQILRDNHKVSLDDKTIEKGRNKCVEIVRSNEFIDKVKDNLRTIYSFRNEKDLDEDFFQRLFDEASSNDITYYSAIKDENLSRIFDIIVNVYEKYRLTLSEDDPDKFYENVLEHFCIYDSRIQSKNQSAPSQEEIVSAFIQINHALGQKSIELAESGIIDYADMLYLPYFWELNPRWHYQYIFIDECQDLSKARQEIILKYQYEHFCRIIAVGDPHQAIYGFDGADITSFETMAERINATKFSLYGSFRCPKKVVKKAQTINPNIKANRGANGHLRNISRQRLLKELKPGAFIVARKKSTLSELVWDLIPSCLKLDIIPEVRSEIIAKLKGLFTEYEYTRIIDESNYKSHRQKVIRRNHHKIERKCEFDPDGEWEKCMPILQLCMNKLKEWNCATVKETVEKIIGEYMPETVEEKDSTNYIRVLTIHQAKGLQAEKVFILDADLLPFKHKNMLEWEERQEDNLTYVAYTRAKDTLYLVKSEQPDYFSDFEIPDYNPWEDEQLLALSEKDLEEIFRMETSPFYES